MSSWLLSLNIKLEFTIHTNASRRNTTWKSIDVNLRVRCPLGLRFIFQLWFYPFLNSDMHSRMWVHNLPSPSQIRTTGKDDEIWSVMLLFRDTLTRNWYAKRYSCPEKNKESGVFQVTTIKHYAADCHEVDLKRRSSPSLSRKSSSWVPNRFLREQGRKGRTWRSVQMRRFHAPSTSEWCSIMIVLHRWIQHRLRHLCRSFESCRWS